MASGTVTGDNNIALGDGSGKNVTDGVSNISLGRNAGCAINTGSYNILFGDCAGKQITTGRHNVVMGKDAMSSGGGQGADCNVTLGLSLIHISETTRPTPIS